MTDDPPRFERILRARAAPLLPDWERLRHYQDLLWILVRRDFVARYQQTILGPAWFILNPLIQTGAFTLIFGHGLHTSTDGLPPFLFYLCGTLGWGLFANIVTTAGNIFQANAGVFTKVYFPRLIVPTALVIGALAPFAIQLGVFLMLFYGPALVWGATFQPNLPALALLPLGVVQVAAFALGVSLFTSALSAKYRDLQHALPFLVQMGLFATPVIYPLSELGPRVRWLAALNPLTPVVEQFRLAFFGVGTVTWPMIGLSLAGTVASLLLGLFWFQRAERTFADTV